MKEVERGGSRTEMRRIEEQREAGSGRQRKEDKGSKQSQNSRVIRKPVTGEISP